MRLLGWLPRSWVITSMPRRGRALYLTFDDGPDPAHTPALLDLLAQHGVRATFFLIGRCVEQHPRLAQRIFEAGHALGNHSYSHPPFDRLGLAQQIDEVARADRVLAAVDGRARHPFRPPRGALSPALLRHFIGEGRALACWSYDSRDYARGDLRELIEMARQHPPRSGDVVLMHDDGRLSLDLLEVLLPVWKADGFVFEAMPVHA